MSIFKNTLIKDLWKFISYLTNKSGNKYHCIRVGKFARLFYSYYPLKYKRENKNLLSDYDLLSIIRELNVCSSFKFKRKKPKRYKFIKRRIANNEPFQEPASSFLQS